MIPNPKNATRIVPRFPNQSLDNQSLDNDAGERINFIAGFLLQVSEAGMLCNGKWRDIVMPNPQAAAPIVRKLGDHT